MGGKQCVHSKLVNTVCPTVGVLSWGIYPHKACVSTRGKVSYFSKTVARKLIRLKLMPL